MPPTSPPPSATWTPPSDSLRLQDGLWQASTISTVSYPEAGNENCFRVEDESFWFRHRLNCLLTVMRHYPTGGMLYDIGGGSGFIALALQSAGIDVTLVEPGAGAHHALMRGVQRVVHATLEDASFHSHSLPAAGAFDVIEHVEDISRFLRNLHARLMPGGRFYCTVPAYSMLWSAEDAYAGHFRRYSRNSLCAELQAAGFSIEFTSYFFTWLTLPVFMARTLPSKLGLMRRHHRAKITALRDDHRLPTPFVGVSKRIHHWELERLANRKPLPFGTSLLCVARANPS